MAKIVIDCADPNDFAQVVASAERAAGGCTITYAKQHLEMEEKRISGSQRESARIISKDSGETQTAVEHKIRRGLKELRHDGAHTQTAAETSEITKDAVLKIDKNDPGPICTECKKYKAILGRLEKPLSHGLCQKCRIDFNLKKKGLDVEAERYWLNISKRIKYLTKRIKKDGHFNKNISETCVKKMVESLEVLLWTLNRFEKEITYGWKK